MLYWITRIAAGFSLAALPLFAAAQAFPAKPIRIIVPFPPGGTTDIAARVVAGKMSEAIGQSVVVENRAGAGGTLGADAVAKSAPDGYTMLMHNVTFPLASVAAQIANRAPYNIDTDFAGVSIVVNVPLMMTAHPSVPANDLRELAALLSKDKSLRYTYGSTGPGSAMHVIYEMFSRETKIEMTHIPYKGAAPLKQELVAGRINLGGDQLSTSLAEMRNGSLKGIANMAPKRSAALPNVPTVRELGFPMLEADGWNGLFVPAKTPREVIDRLQREVASALKDPAVSKRLTDLGAEPVGSTPAEQEAVLKKQVLQFRGPIQSMKLE